MDYDLLIFGVCSDGLMATAVMHKFVKIALSKTDRQFLVQAHHAH